MKLLFTLMTTLMISQFAHAVFPELVRVKMTKKDLVFSVLMGEQYIKTVLNEEEMELLHQARMNDPHAIDFLYEKARELKLNESGIDLDDTLYRQQEVSSAPRSRIRMSRKDCVFAFFMGEIFVKENLNAEELELLEKATTNDPAAIEYLFNKTLELGPYYHYDCKE